MVPVIALLGRPNVGKSTLFNRLTKSRDALVADLPGLTRDRQYGEGTLAGHNFIVVDTGGISWFENTSRATEIESQVLAQALHAAAEADLCLFMVDARAGLTPADEQLFARLRAQANAPVLVVNKVDGLDQDQACAEFYRLGAARLYPVSASQGRGVTALLQELLAPFNQQTSQEATAPPNPTEASVTIPGPNKAKAVASPPHATTSTQAHPAVPSPPATSTPAAVPTINIAIAGRPNVGKSTLVNRLLGEERVVVCDEPGTTRDSVAIPFVRRDRSYILIDTAGVRRRGKTRQRVEKFSVIKSLQAIQQAHVVILLMDATVGVVEQDLHLLGYILEAGRGLVIALNKWDGMAPEAKQFAKTGLQRQLGFVDFADHHFISARFGSGVGGLYQSVHAAFDSAHRQLHTAALTRMLEAAVTAHAPPLVRQHRIKLRYAHPGGTNPPTIIIHGKQTKSLPAHYVRYLQNHFRQALKLTGTPVRLELRSDDNPYTTSEQDLTPQQVARHRRLQRNRHQTRKKTSRK